MNGLPYLWICKDITFLHGYKNHSTNITIVFSRLFLNSLSSSVSDLSRKGWDRIGCLIPGLPICDLFFKMCQIPPCQFVYILDFLLTRDEGKFLLSKSNSEWKVQCHFTLVEVELCDLRAFSLSCLLVRAQFKIKTSIGHQKVSGNFIRQEGHCPKVQMREGRGSVHLNMLSPPHPCV